MITSSFHERIVYLICSLSVLSFFLIRVVNTRIYFHAWFLVRYARIEFYLSRFILICFVFLMFITFYIQTRRFQTLLVTPSHRPDLFDYGSLVLVSPGSYISHFRSHLHSVSVLLIIIYLAFLYNHYNNVSTVYTKTWYFSGSVPANMCRRRLFFGITTLSCGFACKRFANCVNTARSWRGAAVQVRTGQRDITAVGCY